MYGFSEISTETSNMEKEIVRIKTRIDQLERRAASTPADQAELSNLTSQLNELIIRVDNGFRSINNRYDAKLDRIFGEIRSLSTRVNAINMLSEEVRRLKEDNLRLRQERIDDLKRQREKETKDSKRQKEKETNNSKRQREKDIEEFNSACREGLIDLAKTKLKVFFLLLTLIIYLYYHVILLIKIYLIFRVYQIMAH